MAKVFYVTLAAAMQKLQAENPDVRVKLADVQHLVKPRKEVSRGWSYKGKWGKVAPYYGE